MRILGLDLETTGLDTGNDRITELGVVLWETDENKPLLCKNWFLTDATYRPLSPEISKLTGLTDDILQEFGQHPRDVFEEFESLCRKTKPEYIVAHNGENFDKPLLRAELTRAGFLISPIKELPWLDTKNDIPFLVEPESRRLKHLALDMGFINPFQHRAIFDVLTMLRVLSYFKIEDVVAYSKVPFVTARALVSYDDRQLAKDQRYSWEKIGEKTYPKMWVKRIKEDKFEAEKKACKFEVVRIE